MQVNLLQGFLEVAMVSYGMFGVARSTRKNRIQKVGKERVRAMGFYSELLACVLWESIFFFVGWKGATR